MWHDNETAIDYINFGLFATACANLIRDAGGQPISIGVSGGWGAGKTSLVKMIERQLTRTTANTSAMANPFLFVTFNPWLYQGFDDARTALMQTVGDAVLAEAVRQESFVDKAIKNVKRVNLFRLLKLGGDVAATVITGIPIGLAGSAVGQAMGLFKTDAQNEAAAGATAGADQLTGDLVRPETPISLPHEIQAFRDSLEELLKDLDITLVVFVDDLDRCLPQTAISTLEAMRLLLFIQRSAFVIAADDAFIRSAVKVHFEGTEINGEMATNYFDKLIQVPLRLPILGVNETTAYIALLFLDHAERQNKISAQCFADAREKVAERLKTSWKGDAVTVEFLQSLVPADNAELAALMELASRMAPLMMQETAVKANPRLIKRFLNTVFLRRTLGTAQGIDLDIPVLVKWHLLERYQESLATALGDMVRTETDGRVSVLYDAEATETDSVLPSPFIDNPFIRDWLTLSPKIGEEDLRPILHLSRDTKMRDFGADELNQAGRNLLEALTAARTATTALSQLFVAAGDAQASIAVKRAWGLRMPSCSWTGIGDLIPLTAACEAFPSLAEQARAALRSAPLAKLKPGLIPPLKSCAWAADILADWKTNNGVSPDVRRAISASRGK